MMNIKMTKDLALALVSVGTTVVTMVVDNNKQEKQAEKIADLVVQKLKEGGKSHR